MKFGFFQAVAGYLLIENPASLLLNRFNGEIERTDVEMQRWALKRLNRIHHNSLEKLSVQKMKRLLLLSYNIPFWRSRLESMSLDPVAIKSCRDIERLPVVTRQELRTFDIAYRSNLSLSKDAMGGLGGTSGTTGTPIALYFGKKAEIRSKALLLWAGDLILEEANRSPIILNLGVGLHRRLYQKTIFVDGRNLEDEEERLKKIYPLIFKIKPDIIYTYPTTLKRLIYWMKNDGVEFNFLKAVIYLAEHLDKAEKNFIKNFFRCPLYSFYGTKECSFIAMECGKNEGFHLLKGWGYLEIVSSAGEVLPLGSWGRIVYTNYENEATPFIRYDTGDMGILYDGGTCTCGITGLKLELEGRVGGSIVLPNGKTFPVIKLHGGVSKIFHDRILQLQFQELKDEIGVNVVPVRVFSAAETKQLVSVCQELVGIPVKFEVFFHERLAALPGGKTPLILKMNLHAAS